MARRHAAGATMLVLAALALTACSADPIAVTLEEEPEAAPWFRVAGLTGEELSALRTAVWRQESWQALMTVSSARSEQALPGRYIATREGLEFHPRDPLEPGRSYEVRLDLSRLPVPRTGSVFEATLVPTARPESPRAVVTSISPAGDLWPANLLRFYVHFSAPMSRTEGQPLIRVVDERGEVMQHLLVTSAIDFWNAERTRYTGFFSTGRRALAAPPAAKILEEGREYTLIVDPAWRDAQGRPLADGFRKTFRVGPPITSALALTDWRVAAPTAGAAEPLVVNFPRPLDVGLLERSLAVAPAGAPPLEGLATAVNGGAGWRFTPSTAWRRGAYELIVLSTLEDPTGNRIGQPIGGEAPPEEEPASAKHFRLPFFVR